MKGLILDTSVQRFIDLRSEQIVLDNLTNIYTVYQLKVNRSFFKGSEDSSARNVLQEKRIDINSTKDGTSNPSNISSLMEIQNANPKIKKKIRKVSFDKENNPLKIEDCCSI